jgi:hypothetical protein
VRRPVDGWKPEILHTVKGCVLHPKAFYVFDMLGLFADACLAGPGCLCIEFGAVGGGGTRWEADRWVTGVIALFGGGHLGLAIDQ